MLTLHAKKRENVADDNSNKEEYDGIFMLEKGVLIFKSGSMLAKNISTVTNFPFKPPSLFTNEIMFYSVVAFVAGIAISGAGFISFIAAIFLIRGIYDRLRPVKYAIVISLNSGQVQSFIHKSKSFIDRIYKAFISALQSGADFSANFSNTYINADNVINVERGAQVGNISDNNRVNNVHMSDAAHEPVQNGQEQDTSNSINIGEGTITGNITDNNTVNGSGGSNSINIGRGSDVRDITRNNRVNAANNQTTPKCSQCGTLGLAGAIFCGNCGNRIK